LAAGGACAAPDADDRQHGGKHWADCEAALYSGNIAAARADSRPLD
jgi:hypothetical protein